MRPVFLVVLASGSCAQPRTFNGRRTPPLPTPIDFVEQSPLAVAISSVTSGLVHPHLRTIFEENLALVAIPIATRPKLPLCFRCQHAPALVLVLVLAVV